MLSLHLLEALLSLLWCSFSGAPVVVWCPWAVLARLLLPSGAHTTPLHSGSSAHLRSCQSHQGSAQSLTIAHDVSAIISEAYLWAKPWTASVSIDAQAD